jgi:hypothetical protein
MPALQVRERDSKSQQLLLTDMFKGAAAKPAAQQQQNEEVHPAAAASAPAADSDADSDDPCAAPKRAKDVEDLFGASKGPDQAKAAGKRGRARVIADEDEEAGERPGGLDGMQVDQQGQQQPEELPDKQQQQQNGKQQQPEPEPMPDRLKDYTGWLAWQKQRWRAGRQERKRRKVEAGRRPAAAADQEAPQVRCWLRVELRYTAPKLHACQLYLYVLSCAPNPPPLTPSLTQVPAVVVMWCAVAAHWQRWSLLQAAAGCSNPQPLAAAAAGTQPCAWHLQAVGAGG